MTRYDEVKAVDVDLADGRHNQGFPPSGEEYWKTLIRPFRGILADDPSIIEDAMLNKRKVDMSKEWDLEIHRGTEHGLRLKGMKLARQVLAENKGYHKAEIPQGTYGDFSKVEEEFHEAKDALAQGNKVMLVVELSDIILAIKGFVNKHIPGVSLEDLISQAKATERAFDSGERRPKRARPSVCNV